MPHIHKLYDFTVSFYILHPTEKKLCLHFHRKLNSWTQPGGHIELDENPLESLVRELQEEVGLGADDYEIVASDNYPILTAAESFPAPFSVVVYQYGDSSHKHIDMPYVIQSKTIELNPQEGESNQIKWFGLSEISDLHDQKQVQNSTFDMCTWIFENYL